MTSEAASTEDLPVFYGIETERSESSAARRINGAVTSETPIDTAATILLKEHLRVAHSLRVWLIVLTVFTITVAAGGIIVGIVETVYLNDFIHAVTNNTTRSHF
jgi:hypothetical protein